MKLERLTVDRKDPKHGSQPARNDLADGKPAADAAGYETIREMPIEAFGLSDPLIWQTKKHVITQSGVVVNADLLQAEEPRRSREERWQNISPGRVSAKPEDYAPKNTFQAIGQGQNKISGPIRRMKKTLDGSDPENTEWLEMSLELLEKASISRQVRTITCPICMAVTLSIRLKKHLVQMHPQAIRDLRKAVQPWQQNEKALVLYTRIRREKMTP
jgi:hypothetical protein